MEISIFSHPKQYEGEGDWVNKLFDAGLDRFHLRKPGWSADQHRAFLDVISPQHLSKIIIHREFELCREYSLEGIHLGSQFKREGLLGSMARKLVAIRFANYLISMTNYSITAFENQPDWVKLAFLSPVFDTISEKTNRNGFEDRRLKRALKQGRNCKLYALGGISETTVLKAKELGFDGASMIGAIWSEKDPLAAYRRVMTKLETSVSGFLEASV